MYVESLSGLFRAVLIVMPCAARAAGARMRVDVVHTAHPPYVIVETLRYNILVFWHYIIYMQQKSYRVKKEQIDLNSETMLYFKIKYWYRIDLSIFFLKLWCHIVMIL